jgi:hypothetical protein
LFLQEDTTYKSFLEYPKFKEQKNLTLAKLEVSTNAIFVHVKDYVDADWAFVEALSRAKDLVTFLKQVLNEGSCTSPSNLPYQLSFPHSSPSPFLFPPPLTVLIRFAKFDRRGGDSLRPVHSGEHGLRLNRCEKFLPRRAEKALIRCRVFSAFTHGVDKRH